MGIFYCLTVLIMITTFILFKKSEEKVNLISWIILSAIAYLGYNIAICMIFGTFNITTNLLFLSIVNIIVAFAFSLKIIKDKTIQKFEIRKRDLLGIFICVLILGYMSKSQIRPFDTTVANASVDVSMHYSAATNFADNMKILSKIDNKTGYNFTTMQTGAYINTGIFMSIIRNIRPLYKEYTTFKIFETMVLALNIAGFYMLISDKLKTKKSYIIGIVFLILYSFAYPYTSELYGFSYLSIAISFVTGLFYLAKIYTEKIDSKVLNSLIVIMGIGIIFSYCLFVPALFSFICIYVFIKDFGKENEKVYFKFFRKNSIIVTGVLLVVTILSICYLVIPTFTLSDQNRLTDAIGFDGQIYKAFYQDFLFYIPFIVLFIARQIKNKKLSYETLALGLLLLQTLVELIGLWKGFVSPYYYYKIYYILWILAVEIAISVMCEINENKELEISLISYLAIWVIIVYGAVSGIEYKAQQKFAGLIETPKLQSLAGIYFDTNILAINNINASCLVNSDRLILAEEMGKQDDMTLKNMLVGGMNTNCKAWMYVVSKIESGGESINDLQKAVVETSVDDFMNNEEKMYFVLYTDNKFENTDKYDVIFQNDAGVILKKK